MDLLARGIASRSKWIKPLVFAGLYILAIGLIYWVLPRNPDCNRQVGPTYIGIDWMCAFRPAVVNLFHFHTPYTGLYFNPPWTLLLLAPLALLPTGLGSAALFVLNLLGFAIAAARLKMGRAAMAFFITIPFIWTSARQGNLDWLVALGATLPPQAGLFLVVTKPQAGVAVVIFWLVEALRKGGVREAARVFAPVTAAYLVSFALFGLWIIPPRWVIVHVMNYSLWPISIPVGLVLLAAALHSQKVNRAITASPFLSPYVLTLTWSVAYLGLGDWEMIAAVIGTWILGIIAPNFGLYPIRLMP